MSRRPWIHLNFAVCEDGRMSAGGAALPISCQCDWQRVHALRESYDAVAVGAGTWINDRPRLNVRPESLGREPRRQPARVIFAGTRDCCLPPDVRRTFVVGDRTPDSDENAVFIHCPGHGLAAALESLGRHGVSSLLVEGGPTLLSSFVAQGFFDRITVFVRTDSDAAAAQAAGVALPGLPALQADRLGEGVLLGYGKKEILARRFE